MSHRVIFEVRKNYIEMCFEKRILKCSRYYFRCAAQIRTDICFQLLSFPAI